MDLAIAIQNLITEYEKLINDHRHPPDMTTREYDHLCGGDARMRKVVIDLRNILKEHRTVSEDEDVKLYQE